MEAFIGLGVLAGIGLAFFVLYALTGIIIVQPFTQVVVLRFGKYKYTVSDEGLNYVFPLSRKLYRLSSQVMTTELPRMIVVEASGNPIEVSAMCAYRVKEAHKAVLEVENYQAFVQSLSTVVIKNVCAHYPYESQNPQQPCLKRESEIVRGHLVKELQHMLQSAGVEVLDLRLNDLAYTPEIAQSMLLRQQAMAMVDARRTLVEGAVLTVHGALTKMHENGIVLPGDSIQVFASNLMLVLCSGERIQTVMPIEVDELSARTLGGAL